MKALFIVDNRPTSGLGHVIRCRALADELVARGWDAEMIGPTSTAASRYDVCILDLRPDVRAYMAPERCVQIVDDMTPVSSCDILVCGSAGATVDMFQGSAADRVLAGPQFSLLRSQFSRDRVPQYRHGIADLRKATGWSAEDMVREMSETLVAITYGGMRAMECACTGTPSVVLPRNDGEHMNARGLMEAGACVIANDYEAQSMAETMLECPKLLEKMGQNGRDLVDGKGTKRVAKAIIDTFGWNPHR